MSLGDAVKAANYLLDHLESQQGKELMKYVDLVAKSTNRNDLKQRAKDLYAHLTKQQLGDFWLKNALDKVALTFSRLNETKAQRAADFISKQSIRLQNFESGMKGMNLGDLDPLSEIRSFCIDFDSFILTIRGSKARLSMSRRDANKKIFGAIAGIIGLGLTGTVAAQITKAVEIIESESNKLAEIQRKEEEERRRLRDEKARLYELNRKMVDTNNPSSALLSECSDVYEATMKLAGDIKLNTVKNIDGKRRYFKGKFPTFSIIIFQKKPYKRYFCRLYVTFAAEQPLKGNRGEVPFYAFPFFFISTKDKNKLLFKPKYSVSVGYHGPDKVYQYINGKREERNYIRMHPQTPFDSTGCVTVVSLYTYDDEGRERLKYYFPGMNFETAVEAFDSFMVEKFDGLVLKVNVNVDPDERPIPKIYASSGNETSGIN